MRRELHNAALDAAGDAWRPSHSRVAAPNEPPYTPTADCDGRLPTDARRRFPTRAKPA